MVAIKSGSQTGGVAGILITSFFGISSPSDANCAEHANRAISLKTGCDSVLQLHPGLFWQ
jgi:hypothetical protein